MRVLGVDPGLTRCGLGVVEGERGRVRMVAVGVVRTPSDAEPGQRLVYLESQFDQWLEKFGPDVVAVERVFADVNVASVMTTAHATAIALLVAARRGIPVVFHTPTEVKAAVTGTWSRPQGPGQRHGDADPSLSEPPRPADAADALALVVCHVWRGEAQASIDAARKALDARRVAT